jgi:hypothetical protein
MIYYVGWLVITVTSGGCSGLWIYFSLYGRRIYKIPFGYIVYICDELSGDKIMSVLSKY